MPNPPIHQWGPDASNFSEWYDGSINWDGRLAREVPILTDVFGPPGGGGIIDAGCGTGRHLCALARQGYRVVGADISEEMLDIARRHARELGVDIRFVQSPYATLHETVGGGFDGIFCLANSLPAAGTAQAVAQALEQFARCLRPGGRFCIEALNYTPMIEAAGGGVGEDAAAQEGKAGTKSDPAAEGFQLDPTRIVVTKISLGSDEPKAAKAADEPRKGALYPITIGEFDRWCAACGLRIDERWGSVLREPFDVNRSVDLIVVGTRT